MSPDTLKAIRARCEAATAGPWTSTYGYNGGGMATSFLAIPAHNSGGTVEMLCEDADFITNARTDVPALLAEIDRLRGLAAKWRAEVGLSRESVDYAILSCADDVDGGES